MIFARIPSRVRLDVLAKRLCALGANLTIRLPGHDPVTLGSRSDAATVSLHNESALTAVLGQDHLAAAEAYLHGDIDVEGDWMEVLKITEVIKPDTSWPDRLKFAAKLLLKDRRTLQRESISFHYDRSPEFFLPWLDRWRSYSHGFYLSEADTVTEAQARKLQFAMDALALKPGMRVFDMGCGWGAFLEFAGLQGVEVHAITISLEQYRFVRALIERKALPCHVELVDFLDFRPSERFDAAVFMGTFEHFPDYRHAAQFLAEHLEPQGRIYSDFCTTQGGKQVGGFLSKYIWPGTATYVDVPKLVSALNRVGLHVHELGDDTHSYGLSVRAWGDAFEGTRDGLAAEWGEETVRAFILYLRASQYFFEQGKTRAYHLVLGRGSRGLGALG